MKLKDAIQRMQWRFSQTKQFTPNKNDADADQHLNQMLIKLKELNLNDEQKVSLYFAIAKKYDDKKEYQMSFEFLCKYHQLLIH